MKNIIKINADAIEDETIAIWLSDLLKGKIKQVESALDKENAELNRQYTEILKGVYNDVQKVLRQVW